MLKTIIAGVDGRDGGRDALALAATLADATGAEAIAVRAYTYNRYPTRVPEHDAVLRHDAEFELARDVDAAGLVARRLVVDAPSPAEALHRVAARTSADLLVIGSTRQGFVGRVLIGDVAAGALHDAPCAVAVAPLGLHERGGSLDAIGVGFDGTPQSQAALEAALALARRVGARLTLLSVVGLPSDLVVDGAFVEDIRENCRRQIEAVAERARADLGIETTARAVIGSPADELAALSETVDLLVIGSPRPGPIHRLLVGRTGERLVRRASCAVLVFRGPSATPAPAAGGGVRSTAAAA